MVRVAICPAAVVGIRAVVGASRGSAPLVVEMARSYRTAKLLDLIGQTLNCALAALLLLGVDGLPQNNALPVQAGFQGFEA